MTGLRPADAANAVAVCLAELERLSALAEVGDLEARVAAAESGG